MQVHEDFFRFEEAASDTEKAVPERFLEAQQAGGMDVDRMRAQGYDGPENMEEVSKQLSPIAYQSQFMSIVRLTSIGHPCKKPLVRNMLGALQQIAFAFDYSAKRLLAF